MLDGSINSSSKRQQVHQKNTRWRRS